MPKEITQKEINEIEHFDAQEHFADCKRCQDFFDEAIILAIKKEKQKVYQEGFKKAIELKKFAIKKVGK